MNSEIICKEVIVSKLKTRGMGTEGSPIRIITEVYNKDGTKIAESDPMLDLRIKDVMIVYSKWLMDNEATPYNINTVELFIKSQEYLAMESRKYVHMWKAIIKILEKYGHRCDHNYEMVDKVNVLERDLYLKGDHISVRIEYIYACTKCMDSKKIIS